jgi:hypothetical protein
MKANYKKTKVQGDVSMSLYEINQTLMNQVTPLNEDQKRELANQLNSFAQKHPDNNYFMMLCREVNYYTILTPATNNPDFSSFGNAIITLAKEWNMEIAAGDDFDDRFELWLRKSGFEEGSEEVQAHCYLIFPYDEGVVTYGK